MNISLIALNISGAEAAQAAADRLKELFSAYGECDFQLCGAMQQVSAALNHAFSKSELIVVGAEPSVFAKTKLAVLRAMRIKTELNAAVVERFKEAAPELDSQRIAMHAAVPVGAAVFLSKTGFCSGFATRSGHQIFLMLPLDTAAAEAMMPDGVIPYLKENGIEEIEIEEPKPPVELPQLETLRAMGKKVYFAAAPVMDRFRELYGSGNEDVFVFDSYAAQRNGESPKSYLADLSRYAIPAGETNAFGAAISNVFTGVSQSGEQRYNVYIALSDGSSSRVIRFLSQPEETPEELIEAAYGMLLDMIEEKCRDEQDGLAEDGEEDEPIIVEPETKGQKTARKNNAVAAIVFTVLAVLIALAVILFFHGVGNAKTNRAEAGQLLQSNAEQRAEQEAENDEDIASWFGRAITEENTEGESVSAEETETTVG